MTLVIIKDKNSFLFGGFTSVSWKSPANGEYCKDQNAFLFSVTLENKRIPVKEIEKAIWVSSESGVSFDQRALTIHLRNSGIKQCQNSIQDVAYKMGDYDLFGTEFTEVEDYEVYKCMS